MMSAPEISSNPWDRVSPQIRPLIQDDSVRIDIHCHIFNFDSVPDGFLGVRFPFTQRVFKYLEHFLHKIIPGSDTDPFSNIAYLIHFGKTQEIEAIAKKLFSYYYPKKTIFCPLMIDMQPKKGEGIKGDIKTPYPIQIKRMIDFKKEHADKVLPFLAIDPRRPCVFKNIFLKFFRPECHFFGIKIYPSLGYLPSHPELMKVFEVCEEKNIPVVAHCGGASLRSSYHHLEGIKGIRKDGIYGTEYENFKENRWFFRSNSYARYFNNPRNWEPVLHAFPNLRLDLAHFGRDEEWGKLKYGENNTWVSRIMDLMHRYQNVYADVSYNIFNHRIYDLTRNLLENSQLIAERTLYGSDFYMVVKEGHFRSIKVDFTVSMGDRIMKQIASTNPRRFLGLV